jgi:hypothetical protein
MEPDIEHAIWIVTVVFAWLVWSALRMTRLTIPLGSRQDLLTQLGGVIQQNGYQRLTSKKNKLCSVLPSGGASSA